MQVLSRSAFDRYWYELSTCRLANFHLANKMLNFIQILLTNNRCLRKIVTNLIRFVLVLDN